MKNVRELIEGAAASLGIPAACESFDSETEENEYIVYSVVSEKNALYADNVPHMLRSRVYLYYISKSQNNKLTRPDEIIAAMKTAGFNVVERGIDITSRRREDDFLATGYFGILQEYLREKFFPMHNS